MKYSLLRKEEYYQLSNLVLDGVVLDVGGSKKSEYHALIKGNNSFHIINLDQTCEPDTYVDIEKTFPY